MNIRLWIYFASWSKTFCFLWGIHFVISVKDHLKECVQAPIPHANNGKAMSHNVGITDDKTSSFWNFLLCCQTDWHWPFTGNFGICNQYYCFIFIRNSNLNNCLFIKVEHNFSDIFLCCQQVAVLTSGCLPLKLKHMHIGSLTFLMERTHYKSSSGEQQPCDGRHVDGVVHREPLSLRKLTAKWGWTLDLLLVSIYRAIVF